MVAVRILIVDDQKAVTSPFQRILTQSGFSVDVAENGLEAIALARVKSPDVIVMDLKMPKMGGVGAIRELRANPDTNQIPIIVLSAYMTREHVGDIRDAGVHEFVVKDNFDLQGFIAKLRKLREEARKPKRSEKGNSNKKTIPKGR